MDNGYNCNHCEDDINIGCFNCGRIKHSQSAEDHIQVPKPINFEKELEELINRHSKENESGTPDYILAEYMDSCLKAFNIAIKARNKHFGN